MADGDVYGFEEGDVARIRDVVSFVEKNPRYSPKERRWGGPQNTLWEVCTTTPITAATNAKNGATLFTFHQLIDDGTDATPKVLVADCVNEYRGVNRRSDITAVSGSYVIVTMINGEWRPINVLDAGCDCSCSSSSSSQSSSSSSSSSRSSSSGSSSQSSSSSSGSSASSVLSSSGSSASSSLSSSVSSSSQSSSQSSSVSSSASSQTSSTQSSQGSSGTSSGTSSQTSSGTSSSTSSGSSSGSSGSGSGSGTSSGSSGSGTSSGSGSGSSASSGCIQVVTDVQCTGGNLVVTKMNILATTC